VRVAIEKVEGVREVEVTLADGQARIELEPGNRVTVEQIRSLVRDQGFTPKQARLRVRGRIAVSDGEPRLAVTGLDRKYALLAPAGAQGRMAELRRLAGREVEVEAELPEAAAEGSPPALIALAARARD
jgi:copper chaperone CopZ